ncbi:hypothetical protein, partial [Brachybacterium sp. Marseille-Q7125]|uniref:hypothetical protein n=1 Tax=Brachybacterium sp. Marseille-Q7125 TaxID=2932815 RepID=UPI001FF62C02
DDVGPVDDVLDQDMDHVMVDVRANDSDPDCISKERTASVDGPRLGGSEVGIRGRVGAGAPSRTGAVRT